MEADQFLLERQDDGSYIMVLVVDDGSGLSYTTWTFPSGECVLQACENMRGIVINA